MDRPHSKMGCHVHNQVAAGDDGVAAQRTAALTAFAAGARNLRLGRGFGQV
jgi:hypothetical protein